MMNRYMAIGIAVTLGVLGAIQIGDPATLGLTPREVAWLGIVATGLGILQSFLPSVKS